MGDDKVFEGEACMAVMPGLDGEFAVMGLHQPFLYRLRRGYVKIKEKTEQEDGTLFPVEDGLAKFSSNGLLLLCERQRRRPKEG